MTDEESIRILSQIDSRQELDAVGRHEWVVLYGHRKDKSKDRFYFSGLIPKRKLSIAMSENSWDLRVGDGSPGFSQGHRNAKTVTTYHRFCGISIAEPLVHVRNWHGLKPHQVELLEEFRHFHNLYHDRHNDRYVRVDERGEDEIVAESSHEEVRAKTRRIRQFIAARRTHLAIYFDIRITAPIAFVHARAAIEDEDFRGEDLRYSFRLGEDTFNGHTFSRLVGKKLIAPLPIRQCGIWPYDEARKQFADYIIGVDSAGDEVRHTCDPDALANYFGTNPDAPSFLTPIWFKKDVLQKYYANSDKYSVEDGYIRCGSVWGLAVDNQHLDRVAVFLGDLGQSLVYDEQIYWQTFNVTPEDRRLSKTNVSRSFLAEFEAPTAADLVFKSKFAGFQESWEHRYGWQLFRQLRDDDAHVIRQLRIPLTDGFAEFDQQIVFLTKLLVDSLNDVALLKDVGNATAAGEQSISKLQRYLSKHEYTFLTRDVDLLRSIQRLRSTGAAHRKGSQFQELSKRLGLDNRPKSEVFGELLKQLNCMLDDLSKHFIPYLP